MDSSHQPVVLDNIPVPSMSASAPTDPSSLTTSASPDTPTSVHPFSASSSLCVASVPEAVPEAAALPSPQQQDLIASKNKCGHTVLMQRAIAGDVAGVKELIAAGVDVSEVDESGMSAIAYAAVCGHRDVVQVLLDAKAAVVVMSKGLAALKKRVCGEEKDMDVLNILLGIKSRLEEEKEAARRVEREGHVTEDGAMSLLVWAAESGFADVVKLLLAAGADIRARDGQRRNALDCAVDGEHIAAVKALLAAGADVNASVKQGTSPLVRVRNRRKLVKVLLDAGHHTYWSLVKKVAKPEHFFEGRELFSAAGADVDTAQYREYMMLREACQALTGASLEKLLRMRVGIDDEDCDDGRTLLYYACAKRSANAMRRLIMLGADVDTVDAYENTPLSAFIWAQYEMNMDHRREALIYLLLAAGADVNLYYGTRPPLNFAVAYSSVGVVKALLATGADITLKNCHGTTAWHSGRCWMRDCLAKLKLLLRAGADIDERGSDGHTQLMKATYGGWEAVVKFLLRAGVDVHARDKDGRTALWFACDQGHEKIARMLLAARADMWVADNEGCTPLHAAAAGTPGMLLVVLEAARARMLGEEDGHGGRCEEYSADASDNDDDDGDDNDDDSLYQDFCRNYTGEDEHYNYRLYEDEDEEEEEEEEEEESELQYDGEDEDGPQCDDEDDVEYCDEEDEDGLEYEGEDEDERQDEGEEEDWLEYEGEEELQYDDEDETGLEYEGEDEYGKELQCDDAEE